MKRDTFRCTSGICFAPKAPHSCVAKGQHRIRHYGFFGNGSRAANIASIRQLLGAKAPDRKHASDGSIGDTDPPQQTIGEYGRRERYGFVAIVFDGKTTAQMALNSLTDLRPAYMWVDDAAVVLRGETGATRVHCTWAQDDSVVVGVNWGLLTGGLIGLLFGSGGAMAGATFGGSLGAMGGANMEITLEDPSLDEVAYALVRDTSALILVGEKPMLADFASAVEPLGGRVFKSDLTEDDITALRKELRAAA